ncbi:RES family NAD+ phosphorylase [Burkholderia sp. JPY481]
MYAKGIEALGCMKYFEHCSCCAVPSRFARAEFTATGHSCQLYTTLAAGQGLCRLRVHKPDEKFDKTSDLGSPPSEYAKTSIRMSAAGISAFYGAFDRETTIRETASGITEPAAATLGTFRALRDLRLVDLTNVPHLPSIFDSEFRGLRPGIRFLRGFLNDFTAPVVKDGREHIDYVPTQVIAEYLRFIHRDQEGRPIDGILYNRAQHEGAQACVLFFGPEGACDPGEETGRTALVLESAVRLELAPGQPKHAA